MKGEFMKDIGLKKERWLTSDSFFKRAISIYLHWIAGTAIFWSVLMLIYFVAKVIAVIFDL